MALDILANIQQTGTLTTGVDDTGHDVKFFGATSGRYLLWDESDDSLRVTDGASFKVGLHGDLKLMHDGSNSYIFQQNAKTGNFYIDQRTDDADLIFRCDDGSGGQTAYITLDGSQEAVVFGKDPQIPQYISHVGDGNTVFGFADNDVFRIITGGTTRFNVGGGIELTGNTTSQGNMQVNGTLTVGVDDTGYDVKFFGATSGIYMHWDESADELLLSNNTEFKIGTSGGFKMFHNGSNGFIENTVGNWNFDLHTNDGIMYFRNDDGSGGLATYLEIDGNNSRLKCFKDLMIVDSEELQIGTGTDLRIYHNGTDSYINNATGNLQIKNSTDDGDIEFVCDDGSGGNTEYLRFDGGSVRTVLSKELRAIDNINIKAGTGGDLGIYHNGTNSYIVNGTGNLEIVNNTDDGDIKFQTDDGSGSTTTYLTLDGSAVENVFSKDVRIIDSEKLMIGSGQDTYIYHNGSNTFVDNYTGDLYFRQEAADKDIIFQCDDGSGGIEEYFRLDGSANGATPLTVFPDSSQLAFGSGPDTYVYHNGSDFYLDNYTGDFYITAQANDKDLILRSDDGSGGVTAYITLDGSETRVYVNQDLRAVDGKVLSAGNSSDLSLLHTGGNSFITNATGDLTIDSTISDKDIIFKGTDGGADITALTLDMSAAGAATFNDKIIATELDISGNIDVDGTTNLDVVDIDGAVDMASTLTVAGNITANGSIIGDDNTSITNISSIGADSYTADADATTTINMGASQIDCLVADTDVFQVTDSAFTFDPAVKTSIHKRHFAKTTNTDGNADGDIVYFGGTTSMTAGKLYYYKSDGTWAQTDADAASTSTGLLAVALGAASNTNGMLLRGMVTVNNIGGTEAVGDILYVALATGDVTKTVPSGSGDIVRVVGYCLDATNGQIWFNPDGAFVEIA